MLRVGNVEVVLLFGAAKDLELRIIGDTDDLQLAVLFAFHAEDVADGILVGPELLRGALADDGYVGAVFIVRFSKRPAAEEIDTHHGEVLKRDDVVSGVSV